MYFTMPLIKLFKIEDNLYYVDMSSNYFSRIKDTINSFNGINGGQFTIQGVLLDFNKSMQSAFDLFYSDVSFWDKLVNGVEVLIDIGLLPFRIFGSIFQEVLFVIITIIRSIFQLFGW